MTSRARLWLPAATVLVLAATPSHAGTTTLQRVVLLPATDRSSVVFELDAEPRRVTTRRISDSVIEFEAGPGIESAVAPLLKAPAHVRFIDSVIVRSLMTDAGPVLRARIMLTAAAQVGVRASGRRVYVDVSAVPHPQGRSAPAAPIPAAVTVRTSAPVPVTPDETYRSAIGPVIAKLRELGPFLASAAAAGDAPVSAALQPTVASLRATLAGLQPPEQARGSHAMVLSAVERIATALAADFSGDRATIVRQSITTIDVVGGVLVAPPENQQ